MNIVIIERNSVGTDIDISCFEDFGNVTSYRNSLKEDVAEKIKDANIIIANKCPLNEETLKDAAKVELICEFATGFDNIDLAYCKSRDITVCNVRDYCTPAVAQHTFALALSLLEHLPHYDHYVKSGAYGAQDRFSNFDIPYRELQGSTWGIVGMGNIGRAVARIASAFGCRVIYYSTTGNTRDEGYECVDFDTLLRESDFLSLHCPLNETTRDLIDATALSKMKSTAILVNVARGPVVNTQALYDALVNEKIAAAGLDVLEQEPISKDNPLDQIKDSNRLIITPHLAWASTESRERVVEEVYKNIQAYLNKSPRNTVMK